MEIKWTNQKRKEKQKESTYLIIPLINTFYKPILAVAEYSLLQNAFKININ